MSPLIEVAGVLVSADIFTEDFICNLTACKGACCVQGDAGAPLLAEEVELIQQNLPKILPYLIPEGVATIAADGTNVIDSDGDLTTSCIDGNKACSFTVYNNGIAGCGIEKAFLDGNSTFRKPISCYLYPIRITQYPEYEALHYDRWHICNSACTLGKSEKVAVYQFLEKPLTQKYGAAWYVSLKETAEAYVESLQ